MAKDTATIGIKTVNVTGKVLISRELLERFEKAVESIAQDEEVTNLAINLELRRLALDLVEEAKIA